MFVGQEALKLIIDGFGIDAFVPRNVPIVVFVIVSGQVIFFEKIKQKVTFETQDALFSDVVPQTDSCLRIAFLPVFHIVIVFYPGRETQIFIPKPPGVVCYPNGWREQIIRDGFHIPEPSALSVFKGIGFQPGLLGVRQAEDVVTVFQCDVAVETNLPLVFETAQGRMV